VITAVDTSVLLDVFGADPIFGPRSKEALRACIQQGAIIACEVVWAEVAGIFPTVEHAQEALARLEVGFSSITEPTALDAGRVWRQYRRRGGQREHMVPDFLVGSHALHQAERLLSRDRGYYRDYFTGLLILDPSTT
jgi:predicted nucleic acid-binding protein